MPFDWSINPYRGCTHACVYCFARPTHTYLEMDAGRDFETKIVVKVNAAEVLGRELAARRWTGAHIAMGTGTDPYQRVEGRYRLMRGILGELIRHRNPFSILTKGSLILRDVDLLQEAAAVAPVSAAFSIGTLDEGVWRETEPGTPSPKVRMAAVRRLNDAGDPDRGPDRSGAAGHLRRRRPAPRRRRGGGRRRRDARLADLPAPASRRARGVPPVARGATTPISCPGTARCIEAPTARSASGDACPNGSMGCSTARDGGRHPRRPRGSRGRANGRRRPISSSSGRAEWPRAGRTPVRVPRRGARRTAAGYRERPHRHSATIAPVRTASPDSSSTRTSPRTINGPSG